MSPTFFVENTFLPGEEFVRAAKAGLRACKAAWWIGFVQKRRYGCVFCILSKIIATDLDLRDSVDRTGRKLIRQYFGIGVAVKEHFRHASRVSAFP